MVKMENGETIHYIANCNKKFTHWRHKMVKMKDGERPYYCAHCDKIFNHSKDERLRWSLMRWDGNVENP